MLLPHEIRKKEFSLAMGGYARSEVKSYLEYIADNYEKLRRENDELSRRLDAAMEKLDQYHASELASITANVKSDSDGADSEKTAAAAAILGGAVSSLQIELNMISTRLREIEAIMSGVELEEPAGEEPAEEAVEAVETEEADEIEEIEAVCEIADESCEPVDAVEKIEETEETEEIETAEELDEIETLDDVEDEIEDLAVLDEAESELELLETVEDEVEETDVAEDDVLVFDLPVSVAVLGDGQDEADESDPKTEEADEELEFVEFEELSEEMIEEIDEAQEIFDVDEPEDCANDTEPEQIAFVIPEDTVEDTAEETEEAPEEAEEQLDIDDFLADFFDMDDAIDAASDGEDTNEEFIEFVTPDEPASDKIANETFTEVIFDEPEKDPIPVEPVGTAPKKTAIKRFHLKKKKAEHVEAEAPVEVEAPADGAHADPSEDLDQIIAALSDAAEIEPPKAKEADFVEAEPVAPETTEEDDLEAILRALKVQYDNVSAAASSEDDDFDMTSFDEFNYIFGDSSSKIDTVPTENDIEDVLYDE